MFAHDVDEFIKRCMNCMIVISVLVKISDSYVSFLFISYFGYDTI